MVWGPQAKDKPQKRPSFNLNGEEAETPLWESPKLRKYCLETLGHLKVFYEKKYSKSKSICQAPKGNNKNLK